jgi:uncharacterized membrane protein
MKKLLQPGRIIFAIAILVLGLISVYSVNDFIVGRPPAWPKSLETIHVIAFYSAWLLVAAGINILLNNKGVLSGLLIAFLILIFSISRHIPVFMNDWVNAFKAIALLGGSLIIAASFLNEPGNSATAPNKNVVQGLLLAGSIMLAFFFIIAGYAHFKYADFVNTLIPDYIPFHSFFTYACGICLAAGGVGILIPAINKWAALLSGIMVAGWFLLLHIPRFAGNPGDTGDHLGLCESFCFAGIFFVLAALFSRKERL